MIISLMRDFGSSLDFGLSNLNLVVAASGSDTGENWIQSRSLLWGDGSGFLGCPEVAA